MRNSSNPFMNESGLIQKYIGTAYDNVKAVAEYLPLIKEISNNLEILKELYAGPEGAIKRVEAAMIRAESAAEKTDEIVGSINLANLPNNTSNSGVEFYTNGRKIQWGFTDLKTIIPNRTTDIVKIPLQLSFSDINYQVFTESTNIAVRAGLGSSLTVDSFDISVWNHATVNQDTKIFWMAIGF